MVNNMILMGDFNCVMDKEIDESKKTTVHSEFMLIMKKWFKENGMVDIWREQNKMTRDYTF